MMNRYLAFLVLLLPWLSSAAQVEFDYRNSALEAQGVRLINLYPVYVYDTNNILVTRDRITRPTLAAGTCTISNLLRGTYRAEFQGIYNVTTNWFQFPETNGTINAWLYRTNSAFGGVPTNGIFATLADLTNFIAASGVSSFNTRTGAVVLASNDVVTALGFTPGTGGGTGEVTLAQLEGATNTATLAAQGVMTTNTTTQFWLYSQSNGPEGLTFYGESLTPNFHIAFSDDAGVSAPYYFGNAAFLTNLNASALASGAVPLARLGTNTPTAGQVLASDATNLYWTDAGTGAGLTNGQADINFVNLSLTNGGDSAAILVVAQDGPDQVWKWTPNELLAFHGVDRMLNISSAGNIDMLGDLTARHLFGEYAGNGTNLTNLNASALASGTVPLSRLSGITSNQFDAGTSNLLALAGAGGGTPSTLTNIALRDATVPLSLVATNRDANTNHFMLWFAPDGTTNSVFSTLRWTQNVPRQANAEIMFWPAHSSGNPELIFSAQGSLCFYYDFIQWGMPSHSGPTYEYWKWTQWGAQLDRETGETNFNLWPGATWCFQALVRTNSSLTNVVMAGSLGPTSGNMKMPTMQFRPTSTNGSAAWIWMDDFNPAQRESAGGVVTGWGTNTHSWFSDNTYTERFRITAGPDGGVSFNGTLTVNGAVGLTTNYTLSSGDVLSVSNGIIVRIARPPPWVWSEMALSYLARIGTETNTALATNVNELCLDLAAAGLDSKLQALYPFCGANPASNSVNLLNTNLYSIRWTGSFLTNDWTGVDNGGTGTNYADTGWTNPQTNSGTLFAFIKTQQARPLTNLHNLMGARNPYFSGLINNVGTPMHWYGQINVGQYSGDNILTTTNETSVCVVRTGAANLYFYKDGSAVSSYSSTKAAEGPQPGELWLFDCNSSNANQRGQWRGKAQAFAMATNSISGADYAALHAAIAEFNGRMGR